MNRLLLVVLCGAATVAMPAATALVHAGNGDVVQWTLDVSR